jgi:cell division protein FtsL
VAIPFPIFVLSVVALTLGLIINVAQQAMVSQLSYEVDNVKKEIQAAQQVQEKLLAEKAKLESPERIESIAIKRLSMVKAPKISYVRVQLDAPTAVASKSHITDRAGSIADTPDGNITAGARSARSD